MTEATPAYNANAPRITDDHINSLIQDIDYHVFPGTTLTVCCIKLTNGFTVTGESACVCPANFNADIGRTLAFKEAREKIWQLEGYLLNDRINGGRTTQACA